MSSVAASAGLQSVFDDESERETWLKCAALAQGYSLSNENRSSSGGESGAKPMKSAAAVDKNNGFLWAEETRAGRVWIQDRTGKHVRHVHAQKLRCPAVLECFMKSQSQHAFHIT